MLLSDAHDLGQAGLGAGREAEPPCVLASDDTYFSNDLEHSATAAVLYATPPSPQHNTHHLCMGYVPGIYDNTAAAVIDHHTPYARWLGTGRWMECARMPGPEPDSKWVDRRLMLSRDRMLSSHGCCVRISGTAITL